MITYEEQKKMIAELKQRPDIKKLTKIAIILFVIGGLLIGFGVGAIFVIAGLVVLKIRNRRIDEIIVMETAKGKEENVVKEESVSVSVAVAKEVAEVEKKKERVEELVRVAKHYDLLTVLYCLGFILVAVFVLFFPIGSILGIDEWTINVLDLLKDEGGLFSAYAEQSKFHGAEKSMFYVVLIVPIMLIVYGAILLLQIREKKIRKVNGEVVLTTKKRKMTRSIPMSVMSIILATIMLLGCLAWLPVSWLIYAKDIVAVNKMGLISIGSMALVAISMSVIVIIYMIKERKNLNVILAITPY